MNGYRKKNQGKLSEKDQGAKNKKRRTKEYICVRVEKKGKVIVIF